MHHPTCTTHDRRVISVPDHIPSPKIRRMDWNDKWGHYYRGNAAKQETSSRSQSTPEGASRDHRNLRELGHGFTGLGPSDVS